jgi:dipeptidyl aminopeptidase/acylaminoacyl peptidase
MTNSSWIGKDERGGIPVPARPDLDPPPHWRLEDLHAVERPRHLALAPDGERVAMFVDRDGTSDLWVMPVPGGAPERLTTDREPMPYWEDDAPAWSADGTHLAYTSRGQVRVVASTGGLSRRLVQGSAPVWLDATRLVVTIERARCSVLALVAAADPWPQPLAAGVGDYASATVSPTGDRVAAVFHPHGDLNRSEIHVIHVASGAVTALTGTPGVHDRGPAWSPDGTTLAYASEAPGWYEVHLVPADGSAAPRQLTHEDADFDELAWESSGAALVATRAQRGRFHLARVDAASGAVAVIASGGTWGRPLPLRDGSCLATHESATTPPRIARLGPPAEPTTVLAAAPAAVRAATAHAVAPTEVTFRSADGLEIPAFVFWGRGASAANPGPAVVHPHGGPTSLYGDEWDAIAQYFVAKGYTWLAPNFRGSTTYGREFERANHGVWGVADTWDCLAAYDWLAGQAAVDPDRVGIFGASYGSYMALLAVVDDPQHRFACAVAKYGDCDIATSWAQGDRAGRLDLERMMGPPAAARAAYRAGSPIHRIEQLAVPILVAHGEQDIRVSPAQSEELVAALRRIGATYEYVTYPTEGHGLMRREPFLDFYRRLERFLDWHLM